MLGDRKYKVSLLQQIKVLGWTVLINGFWLIVVLMLRDEPEMNKSVLMMSTIIFLLLFLAPSVFLHIQYLRHNCRSPLNISFENGLLQVGKPGDTKDYLMSDLTEIVYCASLGKKSKPMIFDSYRYYKLRFKDDLVLYITSLMINQIEELLEILPGPRIERRYVFFPMIRTTT